MLTPGDPVAVCCGRSISRREMEQIQETVHLFGNLSQKELSQTICEHLKWRTPSGTNKWTACLKLLKKFEQQGLIRLPQKRTQVKPRQPVLRLTSKTDPGNTIEADLSRVRPVILLKASTTAQVRLWNEFVHRYHYLGYRKPFGYTMRYFFKHNNTLLGCVLFSGASKAIKPRDTYIGWDAIQRMQNLPWVINNSRFLIFPWVRVKNLASHVLGKLHRCIAEDWHQKWGFSPVLMETFVDPARFHGTCYLAANWTYLGQTTGKGLVRKGKTYRTQPKKIFVKPLTDRFQEQLCKNHRHECRDVQAPGETPMAAYG